MPNQLQQMKQVTRRSHVNISFRQYCAEHFTEYFLFIDLLRQYLQQIRQETGARVCEKVYSTEDGKASKWWMCFIKKKFMEKSLSGPGQ